MSPQSSAALHSRSGDNAHKLGRFREALAAYRKSLECDPHQPEVWYSAGCAETSLKEFAAAAISFENAPQTSPDWPEAKHNLGRAYFELGRIEEAMALFREAAGGSRPELPRTTIAVVVPESPTSDNQTILDERRAWAQQYLPAPRPRERFSDRTASSAGQTLRIGYLSAFFEHDNWMKPVWGLINQHDRRHFEVHLFSDAPASGIKHGYRAHASDRFYDISSLSNEAAAALIETSGIDLLVDLNGYSTPSRLPLVALQPAPLIVGWFNMYATSGMACCDYLIGDDDVIPPREERFYCEKIVRVPGSYLTFEVSYPVPPVVDPPCLETRAITFGCLAPQHKINGAVIHAWCRILQEVPGSRLVLRNGVLDSPGNCRFVHGLYEKYNISPQRVLLRGRIDHYRFLQTYEEIDVALDTFPYNGGTTTTEAIWQGVPVVTFVGDRWASRTSASLLRAGNLGRFVTGSMENYVSLAIRLGNSVETPEFLADLRRNMRSRLLGSPVCDTRSFARNMERLYRQMMPR
jgi:predicted O-linked N-acetylglucosamine transferase (SPINDLY family)